MTLTIEQYKKWISDIQSGQYVNCVYCGHQYGPGTVEVPADALRRHVANCPEHPLAQLVETCKVVIGDLDMKSQAGGTLTASEKMIREQLVDAVRRATK